MPSDATVILRPAPREAPPLAPAFDRADLAEEVAAEIDRRVALQLNAILHHPEFQRMEAAWRGLHLLVTAADGEPTLKVRALDISKRELRRTLSKFRGTAWDHSPIFHKIYEAEYGQLGGEPYGVLIGDYEFDHAPEDVRLLADIAMIAAAAHAPFIAAASPSLLHMGAWNELANPRDLTRIFQTAEYVAWRALRDSEDSRYLALCLPRFLGRLPYGARVEPVESLAFEEEASEAAHYLWCNAAWAMGTNIARAFARYGWCARIRGADSGGTVEGLRPDTFATTDGDADRKCLTEVALSEWREAELSRAGLIPLLHRRGTGEALFVSAQSLQKPREYDDPAATANAVLSARLPYMFATCRFAHYLKCMARSKVGSTLDRRQLRIWLEDWIMDYVDGSPASSSEEWKAAHPLEEARVELEESEGSAGRYEAKIYLRPHYQLEGISVALRLVSRLPTP